MYNKSRYRGEIMDKEGKRLYISSVIFSVFSLIWIVLLIIFMFNLKMFVINTPTPDSQTEYINFGGFLVGLLGIFIIVSLIILFGVASFVNSAISLILLLLIKNKTIKCKIIMGYNIIVLCLLSIPIITSLLS